MTDEITLTLEERKKIEHVCGGRTNGYGDFTCEICLKCISREEYFAMNLKPPGKAIITKQQPDDVVERDFVKWCIQRGKDVNAPHLAAIPFEVFVAGLNVAKASLPKPALVATKEMAYLVTWGGKVLDKEVHLNKQTAIALKKELEENGWLDAKITTLHKLTEE